MKKEEDNGINIYFKDIRELLDQLHEIDFDIPNELIILMVLNSFFKIIQCFGKENSQVLRNST
jgi:hypothetical protein